MNKKLTFKSTKSIMLYTAAILIVAAIIVFMGLFMWRNKNQFVTEKVVQTYLEDYYGEITHEMKVLSKNMSDELDSSLAVMNTRELTQEELQQLLDAVNSELSQASYNISSEEINKMSNQIVKKVLEVKTEDAELLKEYAMQLDELSERVGILEKKILLFKNYTENDIKNIAKSLDITETQVIALIKKYSTVSLDSLANELGISVDELKKLIVESRDYTDSFYIKLSKQLDVSAADLKKLTKRVENNTDAIDDLAKKLGITSEQLYAAIFESGEMTENEIKQLAALLNKNVAELSSMIDNNKELTGSGIEELAKELSLSKEEIYKYFSTLDASVSEIRQLVEMSDDELRALAEKMNIEDDELRSLIGSLENELTDNYTELKNTGVTRDTLAEAQESIRQSLAAEADEREASVKSAIDLLTDAIELSEGEDAKRLQEAKDELQMALNNDIGNIENALNNANAQVNSSLNNLDVKIDNLNSAITKVNNSIDEMITKITNNSNNIVSLGEQMKEGLDAETEKREAAINGLGRAKAEIHYFSDNGVPTLTIDNVIRD
ncbi:MAG: hypothetical protein HDR19_01980 [Lachnospiraceae bacterium]|nr:hypothetical protein [Lachnospiraceae bacterium]